MNTLEDTLVAALTETAAEIAPDHLPPLRLPGPPARRPTASRRVGQARFWTWLIAPVTAAAAVAGVTVLSEALVHHGGPGQPHPPGALASGGPAALPPRYAALARQGKDGAASFRYRLLIRDTVTGQTLATVDPPRPANSFCDLSGTPDGRTFVAETCTVTVTGSNDAPSVGTSPGKFYRLTVDDQGKVGGLSRLSVPVPGSYDLDGAAVSPDGSKLAVASADHSHDFGRNPAISLYSLSTGQLLRSWTWDGPADIMGRSAGSGPLSWTADGTTIAFPLMREHQAGPVVQDFVQVRLLDTTASGSSLRSTRLVRDFGPEPAVQAATVLQGPDVMITPDGSRIVAAMAEVSGHPASTRLSVSEFSVADGAPAAVLDPVTISGKGTLYRPVLWSSPDGSTLIAAGLPAGGPRPDMMLPIGVVTARGFTPLPGSLAGVSRIAF